MGLYRDLDANFTYDFRIETRNPLKNEEVAQWFQQHGHRVMRYNNDYLYVRGSSYKIGSILESHFPGLSYEITMVSKPVGFEKGEYVAIPTAGVVGVVGWEYGYNGQYVQDNSTTGVTIHVGNSTWNARSDRVVRVKDLPTKVQAELISIWQRQSDGLETLHHNLNDESMRPDRERVFNLTSQILESSS